MSTFDELQTSLQGAVEIKQDKTEASRITRHEVADVRTIRDKLHVSQAEFASAMGTNVDTIKSWEAKHRNPTSLAAKILATFQDNPAFSMSLPHASALFKKQGNNWNPQKSRKVQSQLRY